MGCYYVYALRALTAAANHERSLRPDRITDVEQAYRLGFNLYLDQFVFGSSPAVRQFLAGHIGPRVGEAFRGVILDYYETVARAQKRKYPLFFAEETLPETDARLGIRYIFRNTKEIVLVRDRRDMVCSLMKSGAVRCEQAVRNMAHAMRRCLDANAAADDSVLFLRYEDFVMEPQEMVAALFRFVGLAPPDYDEGVGAAIFGTRH